MDETTVTKQCSKCKRELPTSEFHKDSNLKSGLASSCKECCRAYGKMYRASKHGKAVRKRNRTSPATLASRKRRSNKRRQQSLLRRQKRLEELRARTHKQCTKCHNILPLNAFYRDASVPDGHCRQCKQCQQERVNQPEVKKRIKEYVHQYRQRESSRIRNRIHCRKWRSVHPEWPKAHEAVRQAVRRGLLPHVRDCTCRQCAEPAQHYHHYRGYDPNHWLDVIPLCIACHRYAHSTTNHVNVSSQ